MFDCTEILTQYRKRHMKTFGKFQLDPIIELKIMLIREEMSIRKNKPLTTKIN
jgi:hypothetical protein